MGLDTPMLTLDTTTARGRLRLSPRLMLMLTSMDSAMLDLAMDAPMAMLNTPTLTLDTTTERGRPRPSLRLMPTLATALAMLDTVLDTTATLDTPMLPTASTTARGRLRLSLRLMATDTDPTDTDTPVPTPTVAMAVDTTGDKSSDQATNRLD